VPLWKPETLRVVLLRLELLVGSSLGLSIRRKTVYQLFSSQKGVQDARINRPFCRYLGIEGVARGENGLTYWDEQQTFRNEAETGFGCGGRLWYFVEAP